MYLGKADRSKENPCLGSEKPGSHGAAALSSFLTSQPPPPCSQVSRGN